MIRATCGALAVLLLAGGLSACESNIDRSTRIAAQGRHLIADQGTLKVTRSRDVRVQRTAVVRGGGAAAAAVLVQNRTGKAQVNVPILIDVRDRRGRQAYDNAMVGLQPALQRIAYLPPRTSVWWVNDQLLGAERTARSVKVTVGTARSTAAAPKVSLKQVHWSEDAAGPYLTGIVVNRSGAEQRALPIFAVAQSGGRVVAAGRALVAKLPVKPGARPVRFRIIFVGRDPRGARISLTVAPTAL